MESTKQFWSFIKTLRKDSSGIPALRNRETGDLETDSKQKAELLTVNIKDNSRKNVCQTYQ